MWTPLLNGQQKLSVAADIEGLTFGRASINLGFILVLEKEEREEGFLQRCGCGY